MSDEENMKTKKASNVIRLSSLPESFGDNKILEELDQDGDGVIDPIEFVQAVQSLQKERGSNRNLTKVVSLLSFAVLCLLVSIFGVSIAAAHYAKDTNIDDDGILRDKHTGNVIETNEAEMWLDPNANILDMTTAQLVNTKNLVLLKGQMNLKIKGYAKSPSGDHLMLSTEGGRITFDKNGVLDATGDARVMIEFATGLDFASTIDTSNESDVDPEGRKMKDQQKLLFFMISIQPQAILSLYDFL